MKKSCRKQPSVKKSYRLRKAPRRSRKKRKTTKKKKTRKMTGGGKGDGVKRNKKKDKGIIYGNT